MEVEKSPSESQRSWLRWSLPPQLSPDDMVLGRSWGLGGGAGEEKVGSYRRELGGGGARGGREALALVREPSVTIYSELD
jgi:hypothetical protein